MKRIMISLINPQKREYLFVFIKNFDVQKQLTFPPFKTTQYKCFVLRVFFTKKHCKKKIR